MPDQRERVMCETLDDARRVAYLCAAHARPCELIVRDAYHRVIHHELINGKGDPPGARLVSGPTRHLRAPSTSEPTVVSVKPPHP